MWSYGQVVKWSIETQYHYEHQFSPHLSDNIKDALGLSRDICSQSGTSINTYLWVHWGAGIFQCIIGYTLIIVQGLTPDMSRPYVTQTLGALTRDQMLQ